VTLFYQSLKQGRIILSDKGYKVRSRILPDMTLCFNALKVHKNAVDGEFEKTEDLADFFSGKTE
jgi:hypothetical protein